jgi:hypothetical protein
MIAPTICSAGASSVTEPTVKVDRPRVNHANQSS